MNAINLIVMGFALVGVAVWLSDRLHDKILYYLVLAGMGCIALGGVLALF